MAEETRRKIVVNGREYASLEEMPPEIRAVYQKAMDVLADRDANGVPDILEGKGGSMWSAAKQIWSVAKEAQASGIRSVDLSSEDHVRLTGGGESSASGGPARPSPVESAGWHRHQSMETGRGGGFPKLVLLAIAVLIVVLVLNQLGVID